MVGQIGQIVTGLTERHEVRTEPPYDGPAVTGAPGARGQPAEPADELIHFGVHIRHDATLTSASGANGACPSGRAEAGWLPATLNRPVEAPPCRCPSPRRHISRFWQRSPKRPDGTSVRGSYHWSRAPLCCASRNASTGCARSTTCRTAMRERSCTSTTSAAPRLACNGVDLD